MILRRVGRSHRKGLHSGRKAARLSCFARGSGFQAKVARKTGEISYGFAKYLRDALPNASFIGFTGTPIEKDDVNTPAVFGQYIDVYDINRGVEDGATVPIYYESRIARIELDEAEKPRIDDEIANLTEEETEGEQERLKRKWANVEAVVGTEKPWPWSPGTWWNTSRTGSSAWTARP